MVGVITIQCYTPTFNYYSNAIENKNILFQVALRV